jgi:hypothetical protein
MSDLTCPYCQSEVQYKDSELVYKEKSYGMVYVCSQYPYCNAYVGVKKGTSIPAGRLANSELRYWKKKAHAAFDAKWRAARRTRKARIKAYEWLAKKLEIPYQACHLGYFDVDLCKKVVEVCK